MGNRISRQNRKRWKKSKWKRIRKYRILFRRNNERFIWIARGDRGRRKKRKHRAIYRKNGNIKEFRRKSRFVSWIKYYRRFSKQNNQTIKKRK